MIIGVNDMGNDNPVLIFLPYLPPRTAIASLV